MWKRLARVFRALFGWMIRGAEDPELILRQLQDDLRAKIPEMNRQVAEIVKYEKQLQMQYDRKAQQIANLRPQVEAAVKAGPARKDAAMALITQLQQAETELAELQETLTRARENSQGMMKKRAAYERKIRQQIQEAMRQVSRAKRAQVEGEMASIMGSFEVGDEGETLDAMTERIDEQLARSQARMEVASATVDNQILEVQQDAAEASAETAYLEYQRQFGLAEDAPAEEPAKTMSSIPVQAETPQLPDELEEEDRGADTNWAQVRRPTETQDQ
jgi:phage shock protein A